MSPQHPTAAGAWIRRLTPRPAPSIVAGSTHAGAAPAGPTRLRLICLHPAGAGASLYRDWPAALPADVEVLAVQLPGRETRLFDPCLTDYRQVVDELHAALRPLLTGRYALFGHSMGAMLGYGLALAAAEHGDPAPVRLLVSGCGGPGSAPREPGRADWSDEELVADLRKMGGTPEEVLAQPDLLDLILPPLRADYQVCEGYYQPRPQAPRLSCPISVLGGRDDNVTPADLDLWSAVTTADTSVRLFDGGHFFLTGPAAPAVLAAVTADLADR
ncbi:thioesterase II family protein [Kitasatospora sp. LaBMicrA B282]|uniref:thioesterase II family protein n=1 Tax=Kitasatospora sp. LaBMicrA B282 TaxID=3420949 RepID=UPI003D13D1FF